MHPGDDTVPAALANPPWERLHERLLAQVAARVGAGDTSGAAALRAIVDTWWSEQQRWTEEASTVCALHHEINNALVGVSGNVQILLMGPAGREPGVRERLQVVLRESQRITEASVRLRRLRLALGGGSKTTEPGRSQGEAA